MGSKRELGRYAWATGLVAVTTALAAGIRALTPLADIEMLYLLAVMIAAAALGRGPSVLAAALSVAAYDFFFVLPYLTFAVANSQHILTFAMMFAVGLVISELTARIREQQRDAQEREARTAALYALSRELGEQARSAALRAKSEEMRASLLSAVSHDLRTPLAAITGAATSLRDHGGSLSTHVQADLLDTICEEAERLERLVANLLDMTRLEGGSVTLKRDWVPLDEILGAALGRLDAKLTAHPIAVDLPSSLPLLSVDAVLLEQVFVNLLENAAKYTPEGTPIEIGARVDGDRVAIEVVDHGPGLPHGREDAVFEKFVRGTHTGVPGVGLGLPICRAIAEAHGGTIRAHNRPGAGAVFRVLLPLHGPAPAVPAEAAG